MACFECAASGYTHCKSTEVVDVVPEEDRERGDLSLLNLHGDSTTSGQPDLGKLRREIDIEYKIKKRDSLRLDNPRIADSFDFPCSRHLQAVDISGFTLDGKIYLLSAPIAEPLSQVYLIRIPMTKGVLS